MPQMPATNKIMMPIRFLTVMWLGCRFLLSSSAFPQSPPPAADKSPKTIATQSGSDSLSGDEIARRINAREEGSQVSRSMIIRLEAQSGAVRERSTRIFRKNYASEKRIVIFYLAPRNVRGTAFLSFNYFDSHREDARWLYLPALRKVRRIAASDRGDYFLGTDFTYEDINNETKVNVEDYRRENLGWDEWDGRRCLLLSAVPINDQVRRELGYGRVLSWVDPEIWMLRKADYYDEENELLKSVYFRNIRRVQGIWTAHELFVQNHQNGHSTTLKFEEIDYQSPIDDRLFTQRALPAGL